MASTERSNGAINWMDALVEEAKAQTPPDGAFTVTDFIARVGGNGDGKHMGRDAAIGFLDAKVKAGRLHSAKFLTGTGHTWFYWPANPKAK